MWGRKLLKVFSPTPPLSKLIVKFLKWGIGGSDLFEHRDKRCEVTPPEIFLENHYSPSSSMQRIVTRVSLAGMAQVKSVRSQSPLIISSTAVPSMISIFLTL